MKKGDSRTYNPKKWKLLQRIAHDLNRMQSPKSYGRTEGEMQDDGERGKMAEAHYASQERLTKELTAQAEAHQNTGWDGGQDLPKTAIKSLKPGDHLVPIEAGDESSDVLVALEVDPTTRTITCLGQVDPRKRHRFADSEGRPGLMGVYVNELE